jgi:hypothetical protein
MTIREIASSWDYGRAVQHVCRPESSGYLSGRRTVGAIDIREREDAFASSMEANTMVEEIIGLIAKSHILRRAVCRRSWKSEIKDLKSFLAARYAIS